MVLEDQAALLGIQDFLERCLTVGLRVFPQLWQALLRSRTSVFFYPLVMPLHIPQLSPKALLMGQNSHMRTCPSSLMPSDWNPAVFVLKGVFNPRRQDFYCRNLRASTMVSRPGYFLNLDQIEFGRNMKGMIHIKESNSFCENTQ